MGFWGQGFLTDWGHAIENLGGTVGNGFGAALDLAGLTPPTGTYDPTTDTYSGTDWDKTLQDLGKTLHDVKGGTGWVGDSVAWTMKKDQEIYSNWVSRPLSTLLLVGDYTDTSSQWAKDHPGSSWGGGFGTLINGDAWSHAWDQAHHTSPGQALVGGFAGDMSNPHEIDDLKRHWWFSMLSGSFDAAATFSLDPLGKLGSVGKYARLGKTTESLDGVLTRMGEHPQTDMELAGAKSPLTPSGVNPAKVAPGVIDEPAPELADNPALRIASDADLIPNRVESTAVPASPQGVIVSSKPMQKALDWMQMQSDKFPTAVESAKAIRQHPVLRESPNSGLIAGLMADSDRATKELVMRVALNDAPATLALQQTRADIFERLALLSDAQNTLIQRYSKLTDAGFIPDAVQRATDEGAKARMSAEITALEKQHSFLNDVLGRPKDENPVTVEGEADQGNAADLGIQGQVNQVPKGIAPGLGFQGVASALPGMKGSLPALAGKVGERIVPSRVADASGTINASIAQAAANVRSKIDYAAGKYGSSVKQNIFYYNGFNTPIRVIGAGTGAVANFFGGRRPQGWVDMNDPEGWRDVDDMLKRVKGFDPARRNELVSRFMRATGESDKLAIANQAERDAFTHIGAQIGIGPDDMGRVIGEFLTQRDKARALVTNRAYTGAVDPDTGVRLDFIGEDNSANVIAPQLAEQLANSYPLADMDLAQKAIGNAADPLKRILRQGVTDPLVNLGDVLSPMWKMANFMRLGYLVRVLSDDEMAYISKLGAMTALKPIGQGAANYAFNRWSAAKMYTARQILRAQNIGDKTYQPPEDMWPAALQKRQLGNSPITVKAYNPKTGQVESYQAAGAFPRTPMGKYWRGLASEDRTTMEMDSNAQLGTMRKTHNYDIVNQGAGNYHAAWADALNNVLGRSPVTRQLLSDIPQSDVVQWLKTDPAGRAYAQRMKMRSYDPEGWVSDLSHWVEQYAPTSEVRIAALQRKATTDLLEGVDNRLAPAQVHGPMLDYSMGQGAAAEKYQNFQRGFYKYMNQMPTDVLVRHPYASLAYKDHLQNLVSSWTASGGEVTGDVLQGFENQARKAAISDVNKIVLDLSRHSNAAHVFRFVAPFYNAWQQALTRWGRLAYADPEILFKGNKLWQGANNIPNVFDPNGSVQDQNGNKISGFSGLNNADNQLLTFRLPRRIAEKLGATTLDQVQIPKSTLNLVLQGDPWYLPSFGPLVQLPVSKLVENNPQYADTFKSVLPYGPVGIKDVMPTGFRKFLDYQSDESETYLNTSINIYRTRFAAWLENGGTGRMPQPTDEDIRKDAAHMMKLRLETQLISPVSIRYNTPDKFYSDAFHNMLQSAKETKNADGSVTPATQVALNQFMSKYPDYFMFADSISKNNSGIPPTVDALMAQRKYKDILAKAPDVAGAIIGPSMAINGGDTGSAFNSAIYKAQFGERLSPASSTTMREHQDVSQFSQAALAGLGWYIYNMANDKIRVELANRGLVSTTQRGASDLAQMKTNLESNLASIIPQWGTDFSTFDASKNERIVNQLTQVALDKKMSADPARSDIGALTEYLIARKMVLTQLQGRKASGGSGDIQSASNYDLYQAWQTLRDKIAASNTYFSQYIFDRYLHSDQHLSYSPFTAGLSQGLNAQAGINPADLGGAGQ